MQRASGRFKFKVCFEQVCAGYMVGSKLDEGGFFGFGEWACSGFMIGLGLV